MSSDELHVDIDQNLNANDTSATTSRETDEGEEEFLDAVDISNKESSPNKSETHPEENADSENRCEGDSDDSKQNHEENKSVDSLVDENKEVDPVVDENKEVDPVVEENKNIDPVVDENKDIDPVVDENKEVVDPVVDENIEVDPVVDENKEVVDPVVDENKEVVSLETGDIPEVDAETTKAVTGTVTQDNQSLNVEESDSLKNENNNTVNQDNADSKEDPDCQLSDKVLNEESDVTDKAQHSEDRVPTEADKEEEDEFVSEDEDIQLPGRRERGDSSGNEMCSESEEGHYESGGEEEEEEGSEDDGEESEDNDHPEKNQNDVFPKEPKVDESGDKSEPTETISESQDGEVNEVEADKDKQNPAYVPRAGRYFLHDSRGKEEEETKNLENEKETRRGINADRWTNDLYVENEQGPVTPNKFGGRPRQDRGKNPSSYSKPRGGAYGDNRRGYNADRNAISNPFRHEDNSKIPNRNAMHRENVPAAAGQERSFHREPLMGRPDAADRPSKPASGFNRVYNDSPEKADKSPRGRGRGKPQGYYSDNKQVGYSFDQNSFMKERRGNYKNYDCDDDYRRNNARPNSKPYHNEANVNTGGGRYENRNYAGNDTEFHKQLPRGRGRGRRGRNPSPTGDPLQDMQARRITEPGENMPSLPVKPGRFQNDSTRKENFHENELSRQNKPTYALEFKNSKLRDPNKFRGERPHIKDRHAEETPPRFSQSRTRINPDEQQPMRKPVTDSVNNPPKRYSETRPEQSGLRPIRPQSYHKVDEDCSVSSSTCPPPPNMRPPAEAKHPSFVPPNVNQTVVPPTGIQQPINAVNFLPHANLPGPAQFDPLVLQQQFLNFVQQLQQSQVAVPPAANHPPQPPQDSQNFLNLNANPVGGGTIYYAPNPPVVPAAAAANQQMFKRPRMPLEVKNPNEAT